MRSVRAGYGTWTCRIKALAVVYYMSNPYVVAGLSGMMGELVLSAPPKTNAVQQAFSCSGKGVDENSGIIIMVHCVQELMKHLKIFIDCTENLAVCKESLTGSCQDNVGTLVMKISASKNILQLQKNTYRKFKESCIAHKTKTCNTTKVFNFIAQMPVLQSTPFTLETAKETLDAFEKGNSELVLEYIMSVLRPDGKQGKALKNTPPGFCSGWPVDTQEAAKQAAATAETAKMAAAAAASWAVEMEEASQKAEEASEAAAWQAREDMLMQMATDELNAEDSEEFEEDIHRSSIRDPPSFGGV